MGFMDKVKGFAAKNPDGARKGLDKASALVDDKTGGKYSDKIEQAEKKAGDYLTGSAEQDTENNAANGSANPPADENGSTPNAQ